MRGRAAAILIASGALFSTPALAIDYYCHGDSGVFYGGADVVRTMEVTTIGARKPQLPAAARATRGCSHRFASLGSLYRRPEILEGPKLGRARVVNNSTFYYESEKPGTDHVKLRLYFLVGATRQTALYDFNITVVDHPL
jgi:hypothetical protein